MKITKFEQSDFNALENLKIKAWSSADKEHYGDNQPNFFKETFTLIAKDDYEVVGYITIICDSGVAQIEPLMVDPDKKGQGIGSVLLQEAEKIAKEKSIHKLWLETGKDWKSKDFYIKHGYIIRVELPNHTGNYDFVLMDKMI
ncbi:MAG: GNAT family N-acetyltransferase [Candidatus Pacebacteria bacterium]|nr:GNAT family N-acetyltransferase [Candidatus Paceibacterota bacterium]